MQSLAALSVGSEIPSNQFQGVVTGIYDHACNVKLDDGAVITCAIQDYFRMQRGIIVRAPENFSFRVHLRGTQTAHCRGGILRFTNGDIKIDIRNAEIWLPKFEPIAPPTESLINRLWRQAVADISLGFEFPSFQFRDPAALVLNLVGRGPGLTPAGDDVLCGLLAALMLPIPSNRLLVSRIVESLPYTNEISGQMLRDAANGKFIEPIVNLMSALYGTDDIDRAVPALKSVGSSSGSAMLVGILAGIASVEGFALDSNINQIKVA